jgi:DNA-binding CsgD family transcriptional regulator
LAQLDDDDGRGRYRLLETMRQYAIGKLGEAGEVAALRDRHLAHFGTVATDAGPRLEGPDMLSVLAGLDIEIDNMRAAFDWAMQAGRPVDAWHVAAPLWLFWQRHRADEGASRLTAALATPGGDPLERAQALMALADLCFWGGDIARSRQLADEIIALATPAGDERMLGRGTNVIGLMGLFLGDPEAVTTITRALELHRRVVDDYFIVDSLSGRALAGWFAGELEPVRASATEALAVSRRTGNPQMRCRALLQAAFAAFMEGDLDELSVVLDEVIPLADELRAEIDGPMASAFRAWLLSARGSHGEALTLVDRVYARSVAVNSMLGMAFALWVKAAVEDDLGHASAAATLAQAQEITAATGLSHMAAECSARLAVHAAADGDPAAAGAHVAAISQFTEGPHGAACLPWERLATAEVALIGKDTELATAAVYEALAIWAAAGNRVGTVTALELLVRLDTDTGRLLEAARLLGATTAEHARMRWVLAPAMRPALDATRAALAAAMGTEKLDAALAEGAAMDLKEAVAYARRGRGAHRKASSGWSSLTATELEVVRLVAEGLKNTEIAARLLVSPVTIKSHVAHGFTKLGVRNRAELAAYAMRQYAADAD